MFKYFIAGIILAVSFAVGVNAQQQQYDQPTFDNTIVPKYGRLFTIDYQTKSRAFRVSLVGKKLKPFSSDRYQVSAETTDAAGLAKQLDLVSVSTTGSYKFKDELPEKQDVKIKIQDKESKESELFLLKP